LVLLMVARRAAPRVTLWVARLGLSAELRAAWLVLPVLERERPEMQLERLQVRLVEPQASRRARQLGQEQLRQASWRALRL
jgi:hypothetical protein